MAVVVGELATTSVVTGIHQLLVFATIITNSLKDFYNQTSGIPRSSTACG
jgi:hypothetical protein